MNREYLKNIMQSWYWTLYGEKEEQAIKRSTADNKQKRLESMRKEKSK